MLDERRVKNEKIKDKLSKGQLPPVRRKTGTGYYVPRVRDFEDFSKIKGTLKDTSGDISSQLR